MQHLLDSLSQPQREAIGIVQLALDLYNSKEGRGLFAGPERYARLQSRIELVAVQADSMIRFWSLLIRKMQWETPPKSADQRILTILDASDQHLVLRTLATDTAAIITIARVLHDQDKAARKADAMLTEMEEA